MNKIRYNHSEPVWTLSLGLHNVYDVYEYEHWSLIVTVSPPPPNHIYHTRYMRPIARDSVAIQYQISIYIYTFKLPKLYFSMVLVYLAASQCSLFFSSISIFLFFYQHLNNLILASSQSSFLISMSIVYIFFAASQ